MPHSRPQPKGDLSARAIVAYIRTDGPVKCHADVVEHDGKQYVILSNRSGIRAVYRVRQRGDLKRLVRWPAELESED